VPGNILTLTSGIYETHRFIKLHSALWLSCDSTLDVCFRGRRRGGEYTLQNPTATSMTLLQEGITWKPIIISHLVVKDSVLVARGN